MATLDEIRARHTVNPHSSDRFVMGDCEWCGQGWPCDTAQVLAAHDALSVLLRAIADDMDLTGVGTFSDLVDRMEDADG